MKRELILFIDESGDFGFKKGSSDFYFLTFVLHDQRNSITAQILRIQNYGCFHAGPLIRGEPPYENHAIRERQKLFASFSFFISSLPIFVHTFRWTKRDFERNVLKLERAMAKDFFAKLKERLP